MFGFLLGLFACLLAQKDSLTLSPGAVKSFQVRFQERAREMQESGGKDRDFFFLLCWSQGKVERCFSCFQVHVLLQPGRAFYNMLK